MDRACAHERFQANVAVSRLTDGDDGEVTGYMADVMVQCADCEEPFQFLGMAGGLDSAEPRCSADQKEARLPLRPASARYLDGR